MTRRVVLLLGCALLQLLLHARPLSGADSCTADSEPPRDLSSDGGVLKRVLRAGTGEPPTAGSWVRVRYVGTLDGGATFDRSADDAPLGFTLGGGDVIRGWDIALATMAVGELANLTVQHDYGYGVAGLPPRIPPYAVLRFEVELLSAEASPPADATAAGDDGRPLELPDADAAATPKPSEDDDGSGVRVVTVDGNPVKLDRLGPIVVNKDGSLSRITNWLEMSEGEQQRTLKVVARRNKMRMGTLEQGDIVRSEASPTCFWLLPQCPSAAGAPLNECGAQRSVSRSLSLSLVCVCVYTVGGYEACSKGRRQPGEEEA